MTLDPPWGYENFRLHEFFSSYYLFISPRFVLIASAFRNKVLGGEKKPIFNLKHTFYLLDITLRKSLALSAFL